MDGESNPSSINCHCFIWRDFSCPNDEREASSILTVTVACLREDIIIWTLIQWWVTNDNYQIHVDLGLYHKERHKREREREREMEETNKSIAWKIWRKVHPCIWPTFHELNTWQSCKNAPNTNVPLCSIYIPSHLILDIFIQFFHQKSTLPNSKRTIPLGNGKKCYRKWLQNPHPFSPIPWIPSNREPKIPSQIPPGWDRGTPTLPPWESWENPTQYIPLISPPPPYNTDGRKSGFNLKIYKAWLNKGISTISPQLVMTKSRISGSPSFVSKYWPIKIHVFTYIYLQL